MRTAISQTLETEDLLHVVYLKSISSSTDTVDGHHGQSNEKIVQ